MKQNANQPIAVVLGMKEQLLQNWEKKATDRAKTYQAFFKNTPPKKILKLLPEVHEETFEAVNCLTCAQCCKNYSPRFKTPDIKRISKSLGMKEGLFIDKYLKIDEEGDYVLHSTPCAFLSADNTCSIYDVRPSDCHRFPYTDEDVFYKRQSITLKNISFCPAAYYAVEKLIEKTQ